MSWSVAIVDRSGSVVEFLSSGDRELRGAVAFAAGYGATDRGVVVVINTNQLGKDSGAACGLNTDGGSLASEGEEERHESEMYSGGLRLGADFNAWLLRVASTVEFDSLTAVGNVCGALRSHLVDELERLGLERDPCLDSIEWKMHGEGVENDARTTTLLRMNEEAERPRLGMEFKAWLIEVAGAVELDTLTAVASVCGAMRTHLIDELERVGLERDHCLDSFEWSMSGEQRVDDEKFVDALNVKSVDSAVDALR